MMQCNRRVLPISPYDKNLCIAERARLVTGPVVSLLLITSRNGPKYVGGSINLKSSTWLSIVLRSWNVRISTSYSSLGKECEPQRVLRRMAVTSMAISPCTTKIPFPGSDILLVISSTAENHQSTFRKLCCPDTLTLNYMFELHCM